MSEIEEMEWLLCDIVSSSMPGQNNGHLEDYIDGLVQDCCNSSALAMELLQSYTKLSIFSDEFLPYKYCYFQSNITYITPYVFSKSALV